MNFLDLLFGVPLLWFAYKGFTKGLVTEIASLLALLGGILLAVHFSWFVGGYIESYFDMKDQYASLAAFAITFLGVVVLVHFIGRMVSKMAERLAMGFLNKLAGAAFGLAKVAFVISVVLYLYGRIDTKMKLIPESLREGSLLYKPVSAIAPVVIPRLEEERNKIEKRFQDEEVEEEELPVTSDRS